MMLMTVMTITAGGDGDDDGRTTTKTRGMTAKEV
jgi:hypothetical protein